MASYCLSARESSLVIVKLSFLLYLAYSRLPLFILVLLLLALLGLLLKVLLLGRWERKVLFFKEAVVASFLGVKEDP